MPRSITRPSRSSAAARIASLRSFNTTSCPASAKTSAISAPISPAPTTPIFSGIGVPSFPIAADDGVVAAPAIEKSADFDIARGRDRRSAAASPEPPRQFPGHLGDRTGETAGLGRIGSGGGAVDRPLGDALEDRGKAEQAVGHVEFPGGDAVAAGAAAIGGEVFAFVRDHQPGEVDAGKAAEQ